MRRRIGTLRAAEVKKERPPGGGGIRPGGRHSEEPPRGLDSGLAGLAPRLQVDHTRGLWSVGRGGVCTPHAAGETANPPLPAGRGSRIDQLQPMLFPQL